MTSAIRNVFDQALASGARAVPPKSPPKAKGSPSASAQRTWCFIHEDQLSAQIGPWAEVPPDQLGIVLIENHWKARLRPYHKQRLALVWANSRHFALEQAARGVEVRYITTSAPYRDVLRAQCDKLGPLQAITPAEREMRADILPLIQEKLLVLHRHDGWLTTHDDFKAASPKGPRWRMDQFYRYVRRKTGVLMEGPKRDQFVGGKLSFDTENRQRWDGSPPAPATPVFRPDPITLEVCRQVDEHFSDHPGKLDAACLPATQADAALLWEWAKRQCLTNFGPYEDAMSGRERTLFHTRISGLMNLHRLLPRDIVADVERANIPIASKEGFIRQVLGWREFVRHVHIATDGFRTIDGAERRTSQAPGDGGYQRWAGKPWPAVTLTSSSKGRKNDTGLQPDLSAALPAHLGESTPLPPAFWGKPSGLACLDCVVRDVWEESWSHHITRLMILSNIATLLDVSPRELTDWFWVAYLDAWDWVVEPNVLGMGTFATGETMTTKPYIAGSAYINKMSDYCGSCAFDPEDDCPLRSMYWAFLARHANKLEGNPRMMMPMRSLAKRAPEAKKRDAQTFERAVELLIRGEKLTPAAMKSVGAGKPRT